MVSKFPVFKTDPPASWLSARALLQSDQLHSSLLLTPKEEVTLAAQMPAIHCFHTLPPPRLPG